MIFVIALLPQLGPLLAPFLRTRQGIHARRRPPVIRDVLRLRMNLQQRSPRQIFHRDNDVPYVRRVLRNKALAEIVDRRTELSGARCSFRLPADRVEPKIGASNQHRRHLGMLRRCDAPVVAGIRAVDPVVRAQTRICDPRLVIRLCETGIEHLLNVGLAVAVRVFHVQDVRRAGHNQAALPGHDPADRQNVIGKHGGAVDLAVSIRVFEQPDARAGGLAGRRVLGIIHHLRDIDFSVLVEDHLHRAHHLGFGGEKLRVEVVAEANRFQRILRTERFFFRVLL